MGRRKQPISYCVDCGAPRKERRIKSKSGQARCKSCAVKALWRDQKYRDKISQSNKEHSSNFREDNDVRDLSPEEAAWMGAMIEGEGTIRQGEYPYVCVGNTEVETIATFLRVVGAGWVILHRSTGGVIRSRKLMWYWTVGAGREVLSLLQQVRPYLTGKREKADKVISRLEAKLYNVGSAI